jgi:hypothetical protein
VPFLSRQQITEFTRAHTRAKQLRVLRKNGIRHYVDDDGWPIVTVAAVEGDREQAQDRGWKSAKAA